MNDIAKDIVDGRYSDVANKLYKDVMAKKYPAEADFHKNIKIDREKKTNRVTRKLKEIYLNKVKIASYTDKPDRNERIEIALDAYIEVDEWLSEQLGVPDSTINF